MTNENEVPETNIVEFLRPSPIFAFVCVLPLLTMSIVGLFVAITFFNLIILVSVVAALIALYRYTYITKKRYIIMTETIVVRTGIIAVKFDFLELFRVKDFVVSQSVFERIFGLMTVRLHTSDLSTRALAIRGIPKSNITETIRNLVQETRLNNRIFEIN